MSAGGKVVVATGGACKKGERSTKHEMERERVPRGK